MKDLTDITDYWTKKYPNVLITLWNDDEKFHGIMQSSGNTSTLSASTMGELISQGEEFLRSLK